MRRSHTALALAALVAAAPVAACDDSAASAPTIEVRLVTPAFGDPLSRGTYETVEVQWRQGAAPANEASFAVTDTGFDFVLPFELVDEELRMNVALRGPVDVAHGAPPTFAPLLSGGLVVIPVGAPQTCGVVSDAEVTAPRSGLALVGLGSFAVAVGGVTTVGSSARADLVDLLRWTASGATDLDAPAGPTEGVRLGADGAVFLPSEGAPFRFFFAADGTRTTPVALYDAAGYGAALAARGDRGAVIAGGAAVASDEVAWLAPDGGVRMASLVAPRQGAAIAWVAGDTLWVAGGAETGAPALERLDPALALAEVLAEDAGDGVRVGGHLFVDEAGAAALLFGGVDEAGEAREDTLLFTGCPASCLAGPGPNWESAREGAALVPAERLIVGGAGPSDLVERVVFEAGEARFEFAGALAAARERPAAMALEAGIVAVVGGAGTSAPRGDVEICFPRTLRLGEP